MNSHAPSFEPQQLRLISEVSEDIVRETVQEVDLSAAVLEIPQRERGTHVVQKDFSSQVHAAFRPEEKESVTYDGNEFIASFKAAGQTHKVRGTVVFRDSRILVDRDSDASPVVDKVVVHEAKHYINGGFFHCAVTKKLAEAAERVVRHHLPQAPALAA